MKRLYPQLSRRNAMSIAAQAALLCMLQRRSAFAAMSPEPPILATPDQIAAEKKLLEILKNPALAKLQAALKAEILATPWAANVDARARLDVAIAEWTNSLILKEIGLYRPVPTILYVTDDSPRTWLGHTLNGVGTSGDNPDKIYRSCFVDGDGQYEILGQFDMANRPAQLIVDIGSGGVVPQTQAKSTSKTTVTPTVATLTDRDLHIAPDGRFRITINGTADGANHVDVPTGTIQIGFRDVLSNWSQQPSRLSIRRRDGVGPRPFSEDELVRRIMADLPAYIRFWSAFPVTWMGGLAPNSAGKPMGRVNGWGFVAGARFQLQPGEAFVIETSRGDAAYTGIQINDPWMIQPDARRFQVSLNISQATPNPDGTFTYVLCPEDPGVANWLDTVGMHDGFAILRWQATPPSTTAEGLLHSARVMKIADLASLNSVPRISPEQRKAQIAARESYTHRLRL